MVCPVHTVNCAGKASTNQCCPAEDSCASLQKCSKEKKRERERENLEKSVTLKLTTEKVKDCCHFLRQEVTLVTLLSLLQGPPSPNLTVQKGLPQSSPDEMFN